MVSDGLLEDLHINESVSIRFEVRGGFRLIIVVAGVVLLVSIRFEVRGGFRLDLSGGPDEGQRFQSALRFAVVSDDRGELLFSTMTGCFKPL